MLNSMTIKQIEDFVYSQPRSIQEIAQHINKNWRTADRYIDEIKKQFGTLDIKIFRKGTRGALKIVYWASMEKISNSVFQEILEKEIFRGREKDDFSALDIYQHVLKKDKKVRFVQENIEDKAGNLDYFFKELLDAKKQVLFFSGNLSFINVKSKKTDFFKIIEQLIKKKISIKVICKVDISGRKNIEKLLSLNFKHKKELIEIRHRAQPLRATIIDDRFVDIKEIKEPTGKVGELNKKTFLFYSIKNKEWIKWLTKIFWKMFNSSIDANKRLEEINKIF